MATHTLTHYQILDLDPTATQTEIKQAYRRLAKEFHPDSNRATSSHEKISRINAAYEVLGDPQRRRSYDQQLRYLEAGLSEAELRSRRQRTEEAQAQYRKQREAEQHADQQLKLWLKLHTSVNRLLNQIIRPLKSQINELAADPFDDELMKNFQTYLEECQELLAKAQQTFRSLPNPPSAANAAANLYYCLNQLSDGIDELSYFTYNYDDHHLRNGRELFRIAEGLRREAQAAVREIPR
ncbi:DnaJ domain-containing protein [Leptolyngbya sp. FACHB-17]|uniref:DnaJ domain-containing protein n=1 Tax=unclassified Leptolyngbya TaxID=2650499 RepID=UPI0016817B67|nr:DnaJ domain-containing protein [Leptolyngbya sp. FACHB-17]MBD2082942.1 J domain-containing protein [Leptolyngbya sp. FACHB-17]